MSSAVSENFATIQLEPLSQKTYVWDTLYFPLRLTVCLAGAWLSVEQGWMDSSTFGLSVLGLLIFRVIWGSVRRLCEFGHFLARRSDDEVLALLSGHEPHFQP